MKLLLQPLSGELAGRKTLLCAVLCLIAIAGCSDPNSVWNWHNVKYTSLCKNGDYVRAAFEFEYGLNQSSYAHELHPKAKYIGTQFPKEVLFEPLSEPKNIEKLVELARYSRVLPRLANDIREILAVQLGQPSDAPIDDLLEFYHQNAGRLRWDEQVRTFVMGAVVPRGELLPSGFEQIAAAGKSADGYPLRIRSRRDGSEMMYVPPGRYWVSASDGRWVEVRRFYIDKYEITNDQYSRFCKAKGRDLPKYERRTKHRVLRLDGFDDPNLPVTCILWDDAAAYSMWAGKSLPSEDEWMRAAFGDRKTPLPWGMAPSSSDGHDRSRFAIYGRPWPEQGGKPSAVSGRRAGASPFGVEDMAGNVAEFLAGRSDGGSGLVVNESYKDDWPERIDWTSISPAIRMTTTFSEANPWTGFRCVLILKTTER